MCSLTHDYSFCPSPFFLTGDGRMRLIHPESGSDTALVIRESDSRLLESKLWFGHLHSVLFTFHFSIQAICHLYSSLTLSIILFSFCFSFLCINNMHNIKLYRFSKRKLHMLAGQFLFLELPSLLFSLAECGWNVFIYLMISKKKWDWGWFSYPYLFRTQITRLQNSLQITFP